MNGSEAEYLAAMDDILDTLAKNGVEESAPRDRRQMAPASMPAPCEAYSDFSIVSSVR